jgi:phosphoribosylformylglycinamidine synthase
MRLRAMIRAVVTVTLKGGVLDPQGKAIEHALASLGFSGVESVRQGKVFEIVLSGSDKAKARAALASMGEKLLANTVIEDFSVRLES